MFNYLYIEGYKTAIERNKVLKQLLIYMPWGERDIG